MMHNLRVPGCLLAALLLVVAAPQAQTPASVTESYTRARALLDAAVAAHGGVEALNAARQIRVTLDGHDVWRNQSRRVDPPYDRERHNVDLMIDLPRQRLVLERTSTFTGGLHNQTVSITDGAKGFNVNKRRQFHTIIPNVPAADTQVGGLYLLPQFVLIKARDNAAGLRFLGRLRSVDGAESDVIMTSTPQGALTLSLDPSSKQLRGYINVVGDALSGDATAEVEFVGYRQLNGVLMPTRRIQRRAGEIVQELTYASVTPKFEIPQASLAPPAGSADITSVPPIEPVRNLADGVWAIGGGSSTLVVAFSDHVLVMDSPTNSADVIARIATLAPGKPVRFVVPTHHHDDHSGGIGLYTAAGATIVTTPGNRKYFERMATARTTLGVNVAPATADRLRVETIANKKRVFTDGKRTVEVHDIGPSPHAEEMLVAWIPEEGILFQADLISMAADGVVRPGANNDTTMHFAGWVKKQNWNVKMFSGAHASVPSPAVFEELIKQSLLPARSGS
jgi:glyoxylase-like metal-dependent hydrolase (beta-lactamase superfamily II)